MLSGRMFSLEVPLGPINPDLIDPLHANRKNWLTSYANWEPVTSAEPIMLDEIEDQELFSQVLAVDKEEIRFELESRHRQVDRAKQVARYLLPYEFRQFAEPIAFIAAHQHSTYPRAFYSSGDLVVQRSFVAEGQSQRGDDPHRDGRMPPFIRKPSDPLPEWYSIYTASNVSPTSFFPGITAQPAYTPTETELENAQVNAKEYQIAFANVSTLHSSTPVEEDSMRTFLRMRYVHAGEFMSAL